MEISHRCLPRCLVRKDPLKSSCVSVAGSRWGDTGAGGGGNGTGAPSPVELGREVGEIQSRQRCSLITMVKVPGAWELGAQQAPLWELVTEAESKIEAKTGQGPQCSTLFACKFPVSYT